MLSGGPWSTPAWDATAGCRAGGPRRRPSSASASAAQAVRLSRGGSARKSARARVQRSGRDGRGVSTASSAPAPPALRTRPRQRGNGTNAGSGARPLDTRHACCRRLVPWPTIADHADTAWPPLHTVKQGGTEATWGGRAQAQRPLPQSGVGPRLVRLRLSAAFGRYQHPRSCQRPRQPSLVFFPHPPYDAVSACLPSSPRTKRPTQDLGMTSGEQGCRQDVQTQTQQGGTR